tara:strand:- start:8888 stop:9172 length:285 start_codon:yes stop_codon:yes gene_type:complete
MIKHVLSAAKRVLNGSPNYQVNFTDRDPLKVHLGLPKKIRTFQGIVYRWFLEEHQLLLRCAVKDNKEAFEAGETFKALVKVGGEDVGTLTVEKI